jgi:hypothetical protein
VLPALAILLASTLTVTAPADGTADCPSPAQVMEALNRLGPGLVSSAPADAAPDAGPPGAGGLRLTAGGTPAGDVRIDLADTRGEIVLRRLLRAPARAQLADCVALAETTALIVERYLREVGYEAPPLPPPAPMAGPAPPAASAPPIATAAIAPAPPRPPAPARVTWRLGVAGSARAGDAGSLDGDGTLALGVEGAGDGVRLGARLSVGVAPRAEARWANERADLRRIPFRLGLFLRMPLGAGHLEPGLGGGADLLVVSANAPAGPSGHHVAPFADLALGYTVPLLRPLYLRLLSRAALAVPYDFNTLSGTEVWATPRILGELGVELGFAFR